MGNMRAETTIVLSEPQLDRLELALSGYIPHRLLKLPAVGLEGNGLLLDAENTPVAELRDGNVIARQPLTRGYGAAWRADLRPSATEFAQRAGGPVAALPVIAPPTSTQIEELVRVAAELRPSDPQAVFLVLASRSEGAGSRYRPNELINVTRELEGQLRTTHPHVATSTVVIPWPQDHSVQLAQIRLASATDIILPLEVSEQSDTSYPPPSAELIAAASLGMQHRGAVVLFTGLSGSGKSTIARVLAEILSDRRAAVDLLDGDAVRRRVSPTLGFDRTARIENVKKIGELAVASASTGKIAIAAPIAPFDEARQAVRELVPSTTPFLLVYISTPLEVCESRDRKGLYARARTGEIKDFTGISSPFEVPRNADLTIDASLVSEEDAAMLILSRLLPLVS